ncbi:hypothetical protein QBC36DRAFT_292689 [Triangularia setosa]|uniref:SAP domain-containing protein n=1 Tax=Triangularia setosa TaxID=2587417 RepID=A0AAN6W378_9PEZI|nr:hypothetical protein QBC36DRAFT_292689 [Podospora setosa]
MATDFEKLTVTQLRQELKRRKLATTGLKAALVARLVEDEAGQTAEVDETAQDEAPADEPGPVNDETPEAEIEKHHDVAMDDAPVEDAAADAPAEKATSPAPKAQSPAPEPVTSDTPKAEPEAEKEAANEEKHGDVSMDDAPAAAPEKATPSAPPSPPLAAKNEEAVSELNTITQLDSSTEPEVSIQQNSNPPLGESVEAEPTTITEIVQDTVSRKRRSRSPPPSGDESSSKRARQDDWDKKSEPEESKNEPTSPADKHLGEITPFEVVPPRSPETRLREDSMPHKRHERAWGQRLEGNQPRFQEQNMDIDEPLDEFGRVERSMHPATSALYVKNFMRPLREPQVREYFVHLAAFPGTPPNDSCILDFHVDPIRTHALVKFDSVSAASRVRTALHGKVWPNESNRKELWVDFIPSEKVAEWIRLERDNSRQTRWEVVFEDDPDTQEVVASLVQCDGAGTGNSGNRLARQPLSPPAAPTGPGRRFAELQGLPAGPRVRGRGQAKHDLENFENMKVTATGPPLRYQPVSEELAQRRLDNMQSYYTKDRYRDMGREDEINRYTFENGSQFVDRGKEVFIGIRHPIREARKRRERNELRGGHGRGRRTPSPPPFRRQDDRSYRVRDDRAGGSGNWSRDRFEDLDREDDRRGGDDRIDDDNGPKVHPDRHLSMERTGDRRWDRGNDVPRSRFDGAPLPTYTGPPRGNRRRGRNRR